MEESKITDQIEQKPIPEKKEESFSDYIVGCFFLSCGKKSFYENALNQKLLWTILFFVIFGLIQSCVITVMVIPAVKDSTEVLERGYWDGKIPDVVITNGIAEVNAPQPVKVIHKQSVIVIDTTGEITELDYKKYDMGLLLTKEELLLWDGSDIQVIALSDLHRFFGNPIQANQINVMKFRKWLLNITRFGLLFGLWFYIGGLRMLWLAGLALIIWVLSFIFSSNMKYRDVLIFGLLANAPTIYLKNVMISFLAWDFTFQYTVILMIIWVIMLIRVFRKQGTVGTDTGESPDIQIVEHNSDAGPVD